MRIPTIGRFLQDRVPEKIQGGDIVDGEGNVLGKHDGVPFYTVGQRRGLGIAVGKPLYVDAAQRKAEYRGCRRIRRPS